MLGPDVVGLQRPKKGEDYDEVLRQNEEFTSKAAKSCISQFKGLPVKRRSSESGNISLSGNADGAIVKKPKSKFARDRGAEGSKPSISAIVLGDIVERNYGYDVVDPPTADTHDGFPRAGLRDNLKYEKGRSIFSQQLERQNINSVPAQSFQVTNTLPALQQPQVDHAQLFGDRSYIVSNPEASEIHEESVLKLANMTVEEIAAEHNQLVAQMDPKLVQFLKSRRQMRSSVPAAVAGRSHNLNQETTGGNIPLHNDERVSFPSEEDLNDQKMEIDSETQSAVCSLSQTPATDEPMMESASTVDVSGLPLPFTPDEMENFVHMNIVEEEKLQWTVDLPPVKPVPDDAPYSARFDFQGMLLPYDDESISVTQALHHHGDEPERPGYTLQELFVLGRSTVMQQRVVALLTIANILSKVKMGYYDRCFTPPLLHQLVDKDIFLLLRFSLDDSNISVVTAAANAIRNLLFNKSDEVWLDAVLGCAGGLQQPSLFVEPAVKEPEQVQEMKDHEIVEEDIIEGALRTDLLLRLRYILETLKPGAKAVVAVLEILTRIARHSYKAAAEIMRLPRLVDVIVQHFLTRHWEKLVTASANTRHSSLYGLPVVQAIKLLRVIACRSRQLATDMVHKHHVMERVAEYIVLTQQMELRVRDQELLQLNRESFYLWQVFLSYNLATENFGQLHPVLMGLLHYHWEQTDIHVATSALNHEHGAALITIIEQAMLAADSQAERITQLSLSMSSSSIPQTLSAADFSAFIPVLEHCMKKWVTQLGNIDSCLFTFSMLKLISATMCCLTAYYRIYASLPSSNLINFLERLQEMDQHIFENLFDNGFFKNKVMIHMLRSSNLIRLTRSEVKRDPPSLPSIESLCCGGDLAPVIGLNSPMFFLLGVSNYLVTTHTIHKGLNKLCLQRLLDDDVLISYVKYVNNRKELELRNNWFTRYETHFLLNIVKLAHILEPRASNRNMLFYDLAVRLTMLVQAGDKYLLRDIMKDIVFNSDFVVDSSSVIADLKELRIDDLPAKPTKNALLLRCIDNLPKVWLVYQQALRLDLQPDNPLDRTSLTIESVGAALPCDWVYLPLLGLCSESANDRLTSETDVEAVTCCLSWALVAECLKEILVMEVNITSRFCRIVTVFLAGCDLFLDLQVKNLLNEILKQFMREENLLKIDFTLKISGLSSFYDLYAQLLEQFTAVSYGSEVFGKYILVPLRQTEDIAFRQQMWFEHAGCIRILRLALDALPFPLEALLWPIETDKRLLSKYMQCLIRDKELKVWSPVLYTVALHHIALFLDVKQEDKEFDAMQTAMKRSLEGPDGVEARAALQAYITDFCSSSVGN